MKKISLRVRQFEKERFLTYNIDNEATLDEEILDFIEDEEPQGIVPVIFEEGEEFDTFSYDITDKIPLSELSTQEINSEMALNIIHSLILALIDITEYRIPLSYLVLNRNYIYVDSDYKIEFISIPLEEMQENMDINAFIRGFLANIRYDLSENCHYVARLLTYVNNTAMFNMRNMVTLVEELMDDMGVEIKVDDSADIYVDYQEIEEDEAAATEEDDAVVEEIEEEEVSEDVEEEEEDSEDAEEEEENSEDVEEEEEDSENAEEEEEDSEDAEEEEENSENAEEEEEDSEDVEEEEEDSEDTEEEPEPVKAPEKQPEVAKAPEKQPEPAKAPEKQPEPVKAPEPEKKPVEAPKKEANVTGVFSVEESEESFVKAPEMKEAQPKEVKKQSFKTKEARGIVVDDDFDNFVAEKEKAEKAKLDDNNIKFKKDIKVNRASVVKKTHDEELIEDEPEVEETPVEVEEATNNTSILSQALGMTGILTGSANVPKANPYLIRTNTEERVMITKQNFKIGKASMGVDYTIRGNGAISRSHAIIINKDGVYYIKDNKSTNHTYVNNKMVAEGQAELLVHDCKIVLGDEEFTFKLR